MKKLIGILLILSLTYCRKETIVPIIPIVSMSQLSGYWTTVMYTYNGDTLYNDSTHTNCCVDADLDSITHGKGMIFIQFNNIDSITHICMIRDCNANNSYKYQLLPDKIDFTLTQSSGLDLTFDIISYDKNTLVLKLSYSPYSKYIIGGVYTLKRPQSQHIVSIFNGKWVNQYTLNNGGKDMNAERYQFEFLDNGNVLETSANDTAVHKTFDYWWLANNNSIVFSTSTDMDRYTIIQAPSNNTMVLQLYGTKYDYYLIKVK